MDEILNQSVNPAVTQLCNVTDNVTISDMNYQFYYERVKKPDNNYSRLFILHYKENSQLDWSTSKTLLSDIFTVAKTETVIQQIRENLSGNIISQKTKRFETTVKTMFILSGYSIDVIDDDDMNKILFKMITGIDSGTNIITNNSLSFGVINGFSGNHALQLNFGILKSMNVGSENNISVNNVFLLDRHTIRLIHNNTLNVNISDITNVQRSITAIIDQFRSTSFDNDTFNEMINMFPKRFMKQVSSMWSMIPAELRNYYYMTYVLSTCLEQENRIDLEIKLKMFISKSIVLAIARNERAETDIV